MQTKRQMVETVLRARRQVNAESMAARRAALDTLWAVEARLMDEFGMDWATVNALPWLADNRPEQVQALCAE